MRRVGVLFMCVANSARSQMAEGIARNLLDDGFFVQSAGSKPSSVNPFAVRVMDELGWDIRGQRSKPVSEIKGSQVDVVITLCAEEVCPVYLGEGAHVRWPLPDPAGHDGDEEATLDRFRAARDAIINRIEGLRAADLTRKENWK